jgi:hypothetical protein
VSSKVGMLEVEMEYQYGLFVLVKYGTADVALNNRSSSYLYYSRVGQAQVRYFQVTSSCCSVTANRERCDAFTPTFVLACGVVTSACSALDPLSIQSLQSTVCTTRR